MKKKIILPIILILIILTAGTLIFLKNKKIEENKIEKNNEISFDSSRKTSYSYSVITPEEYEKYLDNFKIDSEEKMKIIENSPTDIDDAGWHIEYLFDFLEKKAISIRKSINYMPDEQGIYYSKYEYELDDKKIEKIKEKVEQLKQLNVENDYRVGLYEVITNEEEIIIPEKNDNNFKEQESLIDSILTIVRN